MMPETRPAIRFPLQIGISSLWSLVRSSLTFVPSIGLFMLGIEAWVQLEQGLKMYGFFACFIGVLLFVFALTHFWVGWRTRASDVLLDSWGLVLEGGKHAGVRIAWQALYLDGCHVIEDTATRITLGGILNSWARDRDGLGLTEVPVLRLRLILNAGTYLTIAEAERPIEMESLRVLCDSIRCHGLDVSANDSGTRGGAPQGSERLGVRILRCQQCGAMAKPEAAPVSVCVFCQARIPVPLELQQRVRAANELARTGPVSEKLIRKLLEQPGARRTGAAMLVLGVPMVMAWPTALAIALARGTFDDAIALQGATRDRALIELVALAVFALSVVSALFCVLRRTLVDRQALRILTLEFGARGPARRGDPYQCRSCEAPLSTEADKVLAKCVYCDADNILGLDLRRLAAPVVEQARGLAQALAQRQRQRVLWGLASVGAIVLLLLGCVALAIGLGMEPLALVFNEPAPGPSHRASPATSSDKSAPARTVSRPAAKPSALGAGKHP